jgi:hypothetical protein
LPTQNSPPIESWVRISHVHLKVADIERSEEYGKNRFFYAVHLRPLSGQSLDFQGNLNRTEKYQVLVPLPFEGAIYNCALPVIKAKP